MQVMIFCLYTLPENERITTQKIYQPNVWTTNCGPLQWRSTQHKSAAAIYMQATKERGNSDVIKEGKETILVFRSYVLG